MAKYYRLMLGRQSTFAAECFAGGYVGVDFDILEDLSSKLPEEWRDFNKAYIPVLQELRPGMSKIAAGLACGALWTVAKGIQTGDFVLCPDGRGVYRVGEIAGDYYYAHGLNLQHRRPVRWLETPIDRSAMSESLRSSASTPGTITALTHHDQEIERLLGAVSMVRPALLAEDPDVDDPVAFAMEKHLEDFLVSNWKQTLLGKEFAICEEEGELIGRQFRTDTGPLDILALSNDKKRYLVVELKRGRASDVVVGQILRYMGFIQEEVADPGQSVEGVIIALEDDVRLRRALAATPAIRFYRYEVSFKLVKS